MAIDLSARRAGEARAPGPIDTEIWKQLGDIPPSTVPLPPFDACAASSCRAKSGFGTSSAARPNGSIEVLVIAGRRLDTRSSRR